MKFNFKKRFGQNFLINPSIINYIVDSLHEFNDIVEIGPGNGALTKELLNCKKKVTAIDIDKECIDSLSSIVNENLLLINEDILNFDLPYKPLVGNLPYNISSKIIEKIVLNPVPYAVFMLQKEVADILVGKDYSKLTVFVQARYHVEKLINVASNNFFPRPKVCSQVVILKKHDLYLDVDVFVLKQVLFKLFNFRRKKISFIAKMDINLYEKILKENWDLNLRISDIKKEKIYRLLQQL